MTHPLKLLQAGFVRRVAPGLATLVLPILLVACGGNGSTGEATRSVNATPNVVVEGAWSGTNSLGNVFDMLLLEDGSSYQVFGNLNAGVFSATGLDYGRYGVSGNILSATLTQYNPVGSKFPGSLAATVVAGSSINGVGGSSLTGLRVSFIAAPSGSNHPGYDYNTAAQLSDIAGAWSSVLVVEQNIGLTLSIDGSTGALQGVGSGCTLGGSIQPRSSHKNVFDVTMTLGPAPCLHPGQSYSSVAMSYRTGTSQHQLVAGLVSPDKTLGTVLYALR